LDRWQILESRAEGADAVLLIVRALDDAELRSLLALSGQWGMDALVEIHDRLDLERAVTAGALLVGVNHRDLATFEVHADRTAELAPDVPSDCTLVALSGISSRTDVDRAREAGAAAVLVGESLVTDADPEAALRRLRGAG
jgi:indole-3-glycerol phosphate synthase